MSEVAVEGPPPKPLTGPALIISALMLAAANFIVVLDTTIANVSVPHIAGGLAVSPSQGTWVITSYSVAEGISVPLTGWLARRFGTLRTFVTAMVMFGVCSFLCGFAPSLSLLVLFRVLQGLSGGPMIPLSQTLLLRIFPPRLAPAAFGLWSMTTVTAPILGPILGGSLCDSAGWPWVFYINVPIAIGVAAVAARLLAGQETPTAKAPVDLVGLGLLIVTVGAFQIMLDTGKDLDWFNATPVIALALTAGIGLVLFIIWELTDADPIVNLRVFRHRGFTVGASVLSVGYAAFFASIVLLPLWLQTNMGYTATWAGYAMAFTGVLAVVMSPVVAALVGKIDSRALISFGVLWIGAVSLWRSGFNSDINFTAIAVPALAQGFAMPFLFVPASQLALGAVDGAETASAAGLMSFMRTTSGAFAASIATTFWDTNASHAKSELSGLLNGTGAFLDGLGTQGMTPDQALNQLDTLVQGQSVMLATDQVFLATSVIFVFAAAAIWLAPAPKRRGGGPPMAH